MKKFSIFLLLAIIVSSLQAQNAWDALRYSREYYQGSARSLALGNAVTAMGGDLGAISINPAASALYRYSEIVLTPSVNLNSSISDYLGTNTKDSRSRVGVSNAGYVGSYNTGMGYGLLNLSFSVGYNKINDFTSRSNTRGFNSNTSWLSPLAATTNGYYGPDMEYVDDYNPFYSSSAPWRSILAWNTYLLDPIDDNNNTFLGATEDLYDDGSIRVPGLVDQRFSRESTGSQGEYFINFGGNVNDRFFFGINLALQNIFYDYYERYEESSQNSLEFASGIENFTHIYTQRTTGVGFNVKGGLIFLPADFVRLGMSFASPTWFSLSDSWSEGMIANFDNGNRESMDSPMGEYDYRIRTPWTFNLGATFTFGNRGLLSFDYQGKDYRNMRMFGPTNDKWAFDDENQAIQNKGDYNFLFSNNLRVGAEIKMGDFFALRAGYNYLGKVEKYMNDAHQISAGFGFRNSSVFMDFGGAYRFEDEETFTLYNDIDDVIAPRGTMKISNLHLLLSLGLRF